MALCAKAKSKKHSKKAVKNAKKSVLNAERAVEEFNRLAAYAGPLVTEGARDARDRAAALIAEYGPEVETRLRGYSETARNQAQAGSERLRSGSERLRTDGARFVGDVSERLGPNAVKLRDDVRNDYVPRAKRTVAVTNSVLSAATLAAIDAARKEFDKGQGQIRKAATTPVKPQRKNTVGKVLLVLGLLGAGAAAGYVAWQKTRPVEDPWAPPADFARAHYPAAADTDSASSQVSDSVGAADAGDVESSLRGGSADHTAPTSPVNGNQDAKVIDPAGDPADNPQDPGSIRDAAAKDDEKRGTHRGDA